MALPAFSQTAKIKIAFGSCSHQDKEQILWPDVLREKPDLWIWLGDNIYGDSENMQVLRDKYRKQKSDSLYQKLIATCPIIGTWDDHDYGANDAGKEYPARDSSQQLFLDFLSVPATDPRRKQQGVYSSYEFEKQGLKVKVILLDTRFFRDPLLRSGKTIVPNDSGTVLGERQWQWLEEELKNSRARVNIVVSSIQVIPEEHAFEKWANFPKERGRLLDLLKSSGAKHVILLSGDRHIAEISKLNWKGSSFYEITSSSLTHGWRNRNPENNTHRIGTIVYEENFGLLEIETGKEIRIEAIIRSRNQKTEASISID